MGEDKKKLQDLSAEEIAKDLDNIDPSAIGGIEGNNTEIIDLEDMDDVDLDLAKSREGKGKQ